MDNEQTARLRPRGFHPLSIVHCPLSIVPSPFRPPPCRMQRVSIYAPPFPARPWRSSPAALGTACCILSAVCYTAANICLRRLTVLEADAIWVMCCKEAVAPLLVGPVLVVMALRGRRVLPPLRVLALLALVGLAVQLLGNVGMQWALGVIGLAVEIPIDFGVMLIASALLGGMVLREPLTLRTLAALGLLLASIVLLACMPGRPAGRWPPPRCGPPTPRRWSWPSPPSASPARCSPSWRSPSAGRSPGAPRWASLC